MLFLTPGGADAVDNVTRPNASTFAAPPRAAARQSLEALKAAVPPGAALWLAADTLPKSGDGQPLASWPDTSGAHNDATQSNAAQRPVYYATGFPGGLPSVRFFGGEFLGGTALRLPASSTAFAVIRDINTTTSYGSGVFFSAGGADNGLNTVAAHETGPFTKDDDVPPLGKQITATMIDYGGSPAIPGHRDVHNKPVSISIVYSDVSTVAFIDGCVELQDTVHGASGSGFMVRSSLLRLRVMLHACLPLCSYLSLGVRSAREITRWAAFSMVTSRRFSSTPSPSTRRSVQRSRRTSRQSGACRTRQRTARCRPRTSS